MPGVASSFLSFLALGLVLQNTILSLSLLFSMAQSFNSVHMFMAGRKGCGEEIPQPKLIEPVSYLCTALHPR